MRQPLFRPSAQAFLRALTTLCVALGCVFPLAQSLGLTASARYCALCCAGVAALFLLLDFMPRLSALAYPIAFLLIAGICARHAHQANAFGAALTLLASGQPLALAAYSRPVVALLALLFGALGSSLAASERAFFPLALLAVSMLLIISFLGTGVSALTLLPLILAALINGRLPGVSVGRILPLAALILLLLAPLYPGAGQTLPELAGFAADLRRAIGDYFFFTDPRTTFSLTSSGFQPLGADRLGGPASPSDAPVMQVRTGGRTLLRGSVKNEYTGAAWRDSTSGRRYLFVNPRFAALRRDLFDQDRPARAVLDGLISGETITVLMRADSASTLYLTQRFSSLTGEGIVPYYSPSSEVFGTRSLSIDDTYTFTGSRLTAQTPGVREAVLGSLNPDDPYLGTVRETCLGIPSGVESDVYALVSRLTAGAENDFDRALAICRHLQTAYAYTLDQDVPPAGRDFVSWFLTTERVGYCTSFASAMAVMARIAGIPARYIEGYAVLPDSDGIARVTQQSAHAWTELYFPGFGWLSFDATPGANGASPDQGDGSSGDDPDAPPSPGITPTPTPLPTPTMTPTPSPTPTATPSPTPEHNDPAVTPTPEITPQPTPTPSPEAEATKPPDDMPDDTGDKPRPSRILTGVLLLLLAVALAALRLYLTSPHYLEQKQKDAGEALLIWYRAVEDALACMGLRAGPGEAPATFLDRAQKELGGKLALTPLARALYASRYSGRNIKRAHVERAAKTYDALLRRAKPDQLLRLYATRLLRGARKA